MRHFVFIDESGEANITNPDPRFNIFVLCGIVFREDAYDSFDNDFKQLKKKYFSHEQVVFHSIKMRKKEGVFKLFQDTIIQSSFYHDIGAIFKKHSYTVLACIVDKDKYREHYPFRNHAYENALMFMCERAISVIGKTNKQNILHFCLEKRGNKKDSQLKKYYTNFVKYGTAFVNTSDFQKCHPKLLFRGKEQNVNGLQFADLCAYPIARKFLSPDKEQLTYNLFENKIFCNSYGKKEGWGLKHFP